MTAPPSRPMTLDEFAPLVGHEFIADCEPEAVALRLIEAKPLPERGPTGRPPFALLFHSPADVLLIQGTYAMRCGSFGPGTIFIAPVIAPPGAQPGQHYEAIFN